MISRPSFDSISTASHLIATALTVASCGLLPNMVFHVLSRCNYNEAMVAAGVHLRWQQ